MTAWKKQTKGKQPFFDVFPNINEDMASMIGSGNNKKGIFKEQKGSSWKLKTQWQKWKTLTDGLEG